MLSVPTDITPQEDIQLAYAQNDPAGGYKVPNLIELYLSAPYLHDGGVAASAEALKLDKKSFKVADSGQLGMAGTLLRGINPDPSASLRVLVDRNLRKPTVAALIVLMLIYNELMLMAAVTTIKLIGKLALVPKIKLI